MISEPSASMRRTGALQPLVGRGVGANSTSEVLRADAEDHRRPVANSAGRFAAIASERVTVCEPMVAGDV